MQPQWSRGLSLQHVASRLRWRKWWAASWRRWRWSWAAPCWSPMGLGRFPELARSEPQTASVGRSQGGEKDGMVARPIFFLGVFVVESRHFWSEGAGGGRRAVPLCKRGRSKQFILHGVVSVWFSKRVLARNLVAPEGHPVQLGLLDLWGPMCDYWL